jgi:murein tripeptide amidase MpaA
VFPDVNPDGKNYSQTHDPNSSTFQGFWWRKNRNPNTAVGHPKPGVDLNRNFDFLWASGIGTSSSPSSFTYKGEGAFSEPETRNVRYLFDTYPNIGYFVDIHSYGGLILYSWGDDNNQTDDSGLNFHNPAYDGKRGDVGKGYGEFISSQDQDTLISLAKRMNNALAAVRGKSYTVQQSVGLYPTSATSDDYAFSRHFIGGLNKKVYGFTIEFGEEFVPPFSEMNNIIQDVCAAMSEFCLAATGQ